MGFEVVSYHFCNSCILLQMTELENKTATTHNQCLMLEHSIADKEVQLQMESGKVEVGKTFFSYRAVSLISEYPQNGC